VGVVRVTWAIYTLWTYKISQQQVVGIAYRWYRQLGPWSVCLWHLYGAMEATRSRHGWVHMFISNCNCNFQPYNFDLFRTGRTSSFCTVAWQLARFHLTRRIARSVGDSWASCVISGVAVWTESARRPGSLWQYIVRCVLCWLCVERGGGRAGSPGIATHAKQAARPSRPAAQTHKYATIACELITAEQ